MTEPAADVMFYHLTERTLERALAQVLVLSLRRGWRVVVRGRDTGQMEMLDRKLWSDDPDGFLPHGLAGGPHDDDQPILLTTEAGLAGADCLIAVGGATVDPAEVAHLSRTCLFFDGNDPQAVQAAREDWKRLKAAGLTMEYWAEDDGRWVKKA